MKTYLPLLLLVACGPDPTLITDVGLIDIVPDGRVLRFDSGPDTTQDMQLDQALPKDVLLEDTLPPKDASVDAPAVPADSTLDLPDAASQFVPLGEPCVPNGRPCVEASFCAPATSRCVEDHVAHTEPDSAEEPVFIWLDANGRASIIIELGMADEDWISVILPGPGQLIVEVTNVAGDGCAGDPQIALYADGLDPLLIDDNDGIERCAAIAPSLDSMPFPLTQGTYTVKVSMVDGLPGPEPLRLSMLWSPLKIAGESCIADHRLLACDGGLVCPPSSEICASPICGDEVITGNEDCDDGNREPGDGCHNCQSRPIDLGNICVPGGLACVEDAHCHNGICALNPRVGEGCSVLAGEPPCVESICLERICVPYKNNGDACDRAGVSSRCAPPLSCLMSAQRGVGSCGIVPEPMRIAEVEPNDTPMAAAHIELGTALVGRVDQEAFDLVWVDVPEPQWVHFKILDGGVCDDGAQLTWVDPEIINAEGIQNALLPERRLAFSDSNLGLCPELFQELPQGEVLLVIETFWQAQPLDYTLSAVGIPTRQAGGLCDPQGEQARCVGGLDCADPDGIGDGICE